jgi:hypothetical protein
MTATASRWLPAARVASVVSCRDMRDEKPVTPDDLRYLLDQITYNFSGDKKLMRKTRTALLRLIQFKNLRMTR